MHIKLLATDSKLLLDYDHRSGMCTTIPACIQCQMYRMTFAIVTMHGGPPKHLSAQAWEYHYSLSKHLLRSWT